MPDPNAIVYVVEGERSARISVIYAALTHWLIERLEQISEEDAGSILAEMQAQAIVVGGLGRYLRDMLPEHQYDWVDDNVKGFAGWLRSRHR
jgi:molybdopterin biosynthesis enzyme MoaB